jgi:hypothetical protein
MNYALWARGVLYLSVLCHVALLWRLLREDLARIYRFLTLFVAVDLAQSLLALLFKPNSAGYRVVLLASSPVIWVLSYLVVVELYRVILEDYPGISSAGRKAITWCLLFAIGISGISVVPGLNDSRPGAASALIKIFYGIERSVILGLLVFLVLIQLFLARYRLSLSRNRILYLVGYALYFGLSMAIDVFANGLFGIRLFGAIDLGLLAAGDLILLSGAFVLVRAGETRPASNTEDTSAERVHLQQQLADMNRLLTRAARGS